MSNIVSHRFSQLSLAVVTALAASSAFSAGLDRSGQDTTAFFQDGTYAEAVYTYIAADISGHDNALASAPTYTKGSEVGDMAEDYDFFRFGVKSDVNDRVSVGVLYDEPWGAAVKYSGDNNFVADMQQANLAVQAGTKGEYSSLMDALSKGAVDNYKTKAREAYIAAQTAKASGDAKTATEKGAEFAEYQKKLAALNTAGVIAKTQGEATQVEIRSNSVTGLIGYKLGEDKNLQVYGGPVLQRLEGDLKLRGAAYGGSTGYNLHMSPSTDLGWIGGVSYSKPEIALKASLTYRSKIDHDASISEDVPVLGAKGIMDRMEVSTPDSVNVDFQTGINPTTLLMANVRYVPWSDFSITPPKYNALTKMATGDDKGLPIADYSDDQWKVEVGLAKRVNPKLAVSGNVGWDSGAGNPTTSLGPIEGYYSVGLGAKYNVTENWAVSAGAKYLMFGDAQANVPTGDLVGDFEDNDGIVAGIKLSYQQK